VERGRNWRVFTGSPDRRKTTALNPTRERKELKSLEKSLTISSNRRGQVIPLHVGETLQELSVLLSRGGNRFLESWEKKGKT